MCLSHSSSLAWASVHGGSRLPREENLTQGILKSRLIACTFSFKHYLSKQVTAPLFNGRSCKVTFSEPVKTELRIDLTQPFISDK